MQSIHPIVHPRPPLLWLPTLLSLLSLPPLSVHGGTPSSSRARTSPVTDSFLAPAFKVSNPLESAVPDRFDLPPFASLNIHPFPVSDHGCNRSNTSAAKSILPPSRLSFSAMKIPPSEPIFSFVDILSIPSPGNAREQETWRKNLCKESSLSVKIPITRRFPEVRVKRWLKYG